MGVLKSGKITDGNQGYATEIYRFPQPMNFRTQKRNCKLFQVVKFVQIKRRARPLLCKTRNGLAHDVTC